MPKDLYDQLSDLTLLKRAWHLAREDSKRNWVLDPYRLSDFGFRLDEYLKGLSHSLATRSYQPKPLRIVDIPKSSLSVRPGGVLEIEDMIVLFAIAILIAPKLDKKLPQGVYSWRVKEEAKSRRLFEDYELLHFLTCADYQKLDELILVRGFRYCAGCGAKVPLAGESKHQRQQEARRRGFTCEECGEINIGDSARRRYLEHKAHEPGGLERSEARLEWAKAGIETMATNEEE